MRYDHNCISVFMYSTGYCYQIVMNLEVSRQIFDKYSHIRFNENLSSGSRVVPCGRTDRHDEANSRLSQFRERDKKTFRWVGHVA
jgi:hypothetical protein